MSVQDISYLLDHPHALMFLYLSIRDAETDNRAWLDSSLGVALSAEQIMHLAGNVPASGKSSDSKPSSVRISVISAMKDQEYYKHLSNLVSIPADMSSPPVVAGGEYAPKDNETIISMGRASKETWMDFMSNTGIYDPTHMNERREKRVEEDIPDDEGRHLDGGPKEFRDEASKEEHVRRMQQALGVAPVETSKSKPKGK